MKPLLSPSIRTAVEAQVLTWASISARPEQLAKWRKQPAPMPSKSFSPSQLKQSEDQTVAAVWAVCSAIADLDDDGPAFADWAVLAATRFCGRQANADSLERYHKEGAWGISPHSIPHHSMHAVSGTISQLFAIRGPNFGVGNGPTSLADGWLAAATLLSQNIVPGLWLVFTGYDGEFLPHGAQHPGTQPSIQAVALALAGHCERPCMRVRISAAIDADAGPAAELTLTSLHEQLTRRDDSLSGAWRLSGLGSLEIESY